MFIFIYIYICSYIHISDRQWLNKQFFLLLKKYHIQFIIDIYLHIFFTAVQESKQFEISNLQPNIVDFLTHGRKIKTRRATR